MKNFLISVMMVINLAALCFVYYEYEMMQQTIQNVTNELTASCDIKNNKIQAFNVNTLK
jgi:hypothetical protein